MPMFADAHISTLGYLWRNHGPIVFFLFFDLGSAFAQLYLLLCESQKKKTHQKAASWASQPKNQGGADY